MILGASYFGLVNGVGGVSPHYAHDGKVHATFWYYGTL